jgi:hypothetical protein
VTGLAGDKYYGFKVRAANVYGHGAWSTVLTVHAADVPAQMAIATVRRMEAESMPTKLQIAWVEPTDNYEAVDAYDIVIKNSAGVYVNELEFCDGINGDTPYVLASTILTNAYCEVEMNFLADHLGFLDLPDVLIEVKVKARNSYGWGEFSQVNTAGAVIETIPDQVLNV